MPYLLRIDSSARRVDSHSRQLADLIEAEYLNAGPDHAVRRRDLTAEPISHIEAETITGFYTLEDAMTPALRAATDQSDSLIAELKGADMLLISAPMYNFGVPSALKAWIDQIVRINVTFAYEAGAFQGLVPVRRAVLALAYGAEGYAEGGEFAPMNFLEPYLVSLLSFLGVSDVTVFRIQGTTGEVTALDATKTRLRAEVQQYFELGVQA